MTLSEDLLYKAPFEICWDINYCVPYQIRHRQRITKNSGKGLPSKGFLEITDWVPLAGQATYYTWQRREGPITAAPSNAILAP